MKLEWSAWFQNINDKLEQFVEEGMTTIRKNSLEPNFDSSRLCHFLSFFPHFLVLLKFGTIVKKNLDLKLLVFIWICVSQSRIHIKKGSQPSFRLDAGYGVGQVVF